MITIHDYKRTLGIRIARWLPALAWMVLIFALSAQPRIEFSSEPVWDLLVKKTGHFGLYCVLGLLVRLALNGSRRPFSPALVICGAYAASDEFHQLFVPGRGPSVLDVAIDALGALSGITLIALGARPLCTRARIAVEFSSASDADFTRAVKVAFDYVLAAIGLILLSPVVLLIAFLVRLDSPGPVFFRRLVIGQGGQTFRLLKFRTMFVDADWILERDEGLKQEYERNFKLRHDPRVTRVGRFLRRFSLDELPQLVNVLAGQMSLVGPRTIGPEELHKYGVWKSDLLAVKPGLTGLWQVSGRSDVPYAERVKIDIQYVRNRSAWLDLQIILRTLPAVVRGKGAY